MPRKNKHQYTQIQIKKSTCKKLGELKIHKNQSYEEIIIKLLEAKK